MRLFFTLAREYPKRSAIVLLCLVLAALADGVGMTSVLPLLGLLTGGDGAAAKPPGDLERKVLEVLSALGLQATLEVLLSIMVTAMLLKAVLTLLSKREVGYAVAQVATDTRIALLNALMLTRWSFYTRQPVGGVTAAFSSEANRGSKAYMHATTVITLSLQTLLLVGIAMAVSWQATLGAIVAGAILLVSLNSLVRMTRRAGLKQTRITRRAIARLTDSLHALKPLKAMSREQLIGPLLEDDTNSLNRALRKIVLSREALRAVQEPMLFSFLALGLYFAVKIYEMPIADTLVLGLLFSRTLNGLGKAQRFYQSMESQSPAFWAIRALIERASEERERELGATVPVLERAITLRGVDLGYEQSPVLSNLSIEIPAGQITGLVGPSGGGKTTIGDLVVGLVRPDRGEVYIDDLALGDANLKAWREQIGYVPQEMFLLNASVAQNVTLGDPDITPEQVDAALRRAGAADFVAEMPEGVSSSVGERGSLLSGGQRQRISIARALVHEPKLLLLDEASAALDPDTERALWESLRQLRGDVTVLAISHQPALFSAADRVYRIEGGTAQRLLEADIAKARVVA